MSEQTKPASKQLFQIFNICLELARDKFELRDIGNQISKYVDKYMTEEDKQSLREKFNITLIKLPERINNGRLSK